MANPNGENAGCSCAFSPICWDEKGNYRSYEMMGNTFRKVNSYTELLNKEIKDPFRREGQEGI